MLRRTNKWCQFLGHHVEKTLASETHKKHTENKCKKLAPAKTIITVQELLAKVTAKSSSNFCQRYEPKNGKCLILQC